MRIILLFSFPEIVCLVAVTSNFIMIISTAARYGSSLVINKKILLFLLFSLRNKGNSMQYFMEGNAFYFHVFTLELVSIFSLSVNYLGHHSEFDCLTLIMVLLPCSNVA